MYRCSGKLALVLLFSLETRAYAADLEVRLVSITSPVPPGGTVTLVIATEPGAICTGHRQAHFSEDVPLRPPSVVAGSDGRAQWSWHVLNGQKPIGERTVRVACSQANRHGSLDTAFDVRF
jgi:hypothetical protein